MWTWIAKVKSFIVHVITAPARKRHEQLILDTHLITGSYVTNAVFLVNDKGPSTHESLNLMQGSRLDELCVLWAKLHNFKYDAVMSEFDRMVKEIEMGAGKTHLDYGPERLVVRIYCLRYCEDILHD